MEKKKTVKIVAIVLAAVVVLAIACGIPFMLPRGTEELPFESDAPSFEFDAPTLKEEALYPSPTTELTITSPPTERISTTPTALSKTPITSTRYAGSRATKKRAPILNSKPATKFS